MAVKEINQNPEILPNTTILIKRVNSFDLNSYGDSGGYAATQVYREIAQDSSGNVHLKKILIN
jgi:hypothetical protein